MKQSFFIDSTDGKLKWIQKLPTVEEFTTTHGYNSGKIFESFHEDMYNREIELVKKSAVEVDLSHTSTRHAVIGPTVHNTSEYLKRQWDKDKVYTINMEEEIVKQHQYYSSEKYYHDASWVDCPEDSYEIIKKYGKVRVVARIIPKKAEESRPVKEALFNRKQIESIMEILYNSIQEHGYDQEKIIYADDLKDIKEKLLLLNKYD